jgi:hypothetical protein
MRYFYITFCCCCCSLLSSEKRNTQKNLFALAPIILSLTELKPLALITKTGLLTEIPLVIDNISRKAKQKTVRPRQTAEKQKKNFFPLFIDPKLPRTCHDSFFGAYN